MDGVAGSQETGSVSIIEPTREDDNKEGEEETAMETTETRTTEPPAGTSTRAQSCSSPLMQTSVKVEPGLSSVKVEIDGQPLETKMASENTAEDNISQAIAAVAHGAGKLRSEGPEEIVGPPEEYSLHGDSTVHSEFLGISSRRGPGRPRKDGVASPIPKKKK